MKLGSGEACVDVWWDPSRGVFVYIDTRDSQGCVIDARVFTLEQLVKELGLAYEEGEDIVV
jgi:hypothetical protein